MPCFTIANDASGVEGDYNSTVAILVTGASGYIGSALVDSLDSRFDLILLDSAPKSDFKNLSKFYQGSILDSELLSEIFSANSIESVVHLAAKKSISESSSNSLEFRKTNVEGTQLLFDFASKNSVEKFVFASSAAIYSDLDSDLPVFENHPVKPLSLYGETKLHSEFFLSKMASPGAIQVISLRFFNVAGWASLASPHYWDVNLYPQLVRSIKRNMPFSVFGSDFKTHDGTAARDYVHISDIVEAIKLAILKPAPLVGGGFLALNISTSIETTVLEVIRQMENVSQSSVNLIFENRRKGEVGRIRGDNSSARQLLNWTPKKSLSDISKSVWDAYKNISID